MVTKSIQRITRSVWRFIIERSGNDRLIKYYRKRGMKIGENCRIGRINYTDEAYLIEIGDHVAIAGGAIFITHDGSLWCFNEDPQEEDLFGMIKIGNNVHIGMSCIFMPNTTVGNNCIIGAGSVVRGIFPDNSVIMGNPAIIITRMSVQKLLFKQNPGRLKTARLSDKQKEPIVKKHFGIQ
jgi:acetyltransferase-like isoleucine patch superfamily enzyme